MGHRKKLIIDSKKYEYCVTFNGYVDKVFVNGVLNQRETRWAKGFLWSIVKDTMERSNDEQSSKG